MKKIIDPIFTGERLIPSRNYGASFYYEHLSRYLFAAQFATNKITLDLGCGSGYGSYILAKYGLAKKVYAIDIDQSTVDYAGMKYSHPKIRFTTDDITKLSTIKDHSIDLITCFEVIEHIKDHKNLMTQIKRVLRSDGTLIISSPNKLTYPSGNPFHIHELTPNGFNSILGTYFKHTKNLYQNYLLSNIIRSVAPIDMHLEESFTQQNTNSYYPKLSVKNTEYLISICSMSKLPPVQSLSISSSNIDGLDLSRGMLSLSKQFYGTRKEVDALTLQLNHLANELATIRNSKLFLLWPWYNRIKRIFYH